MKYTFLIISLLFIGMANAQENTGINNLQIGAKAGLNLANLSGDLEATGGRTSFHIGGMVEIPITNKLSAQPELLYSSQGAKDSEVSFNLDYLNVPIIAKYYVNDELSLEAGPQIGYLLSANFKFETNDNINDPLPNTTSINRNKAAAETQDVKDNVKSIDFGLNFGLGYKLDNGINFSARYNLGLSDANDTEFESSKFKNQVFQISVGYFFF